MQHTIYAKESQRPVLMQRLWCALTFCVPVQSFLHTTLVQPEFAPLSAATQDSPAETICA